MDQSVARVDDGGLADGDVAGLVLLHPQHGLEAIGLHHLGDGGAALGELADLERKFLEDAVGAGPDDHRPGERVLERDDGLEPVDLLLLHLELERDVVGEELEALLLDGEPLGHLLDGVLGLGRVEGGDELLVAPSRSRRRPGVRPRCTGSGSGPRRRPA